jgi:hypothetical protein
MVFDFVSYFKKDLMTIETHIINRFKKSLNDN